MLFTLTGRQTDKQTNGGQDIIPRQPVAG